MNLPLSSFNYPTAGNVNDAWPGFSNAGPGVTPDPLALRLKQADVALARWRNILEEVRQQSLRRMDWDSAHFVTQILEARERAGGMAATLLVADLERIHQRVRDLIRAGALESTASLSRAACHLASPVWSGTNGWAHTSRQTAGDNHWLSGPGQNSSLEAPGLGSLNPDRVTLTAWIKVTSGDHLWHRWLESDDHPKVVRNRQGHVVADKPSTRAAGRWKNAPWHHVAVTFDGAQVRCYLDGVEKKTVVTFFSPFAEGTGPVDLEPTAVEPGQDSDDWAGEVHVYNRVLSALEIEALARSPVMEPKAAKPARVDRVATAPATRLKSLYQPDFLVRSVYVEKLREIMDLL